MFTGIGQIGTGLTGLSQGIGVLKELEIVSKLATAATWLQTQAQAALNFVMSMNPIALVIIAIVALIAVLGYLYFNNEQVRQAVDALGRGLLTFAQTAITTATNAVNGFIKTIRGLYTGLTTELNNMLSAVSNWAASLPQKFWDAGVNAVKNFLSALGIASPGTMQRTLVWEISEMERRTPLESRGLLENVSRLGSDIVDEFGEPTLGVGFDDTLNASISGGRNNGESPTINLNVTVGSVDSEDRVTEIVEAIRRELAWNNATAGRTV